VGRLVIYVLNIYEYFHHRRSFSKVAVAIDLTTQW